MASSNPSAASTETLSGKSPEGGELGPGLWPGFASLTLEDAGRFIGREREVERLVRLFNRPDSGQTPVVWVTGEAGVGKTSLVMAGLLPRLADKLGEGFEWFRITPVRGAGARRSIGLIAESILGGTVSGQGNAGLDLEGRLRQFWLLMEQDYAEAAEYLASCYRRNFEVASSEGERGGQNSNCLVFLDQLDQMEQSGDLLPADDEEWLRENLEPLMGFLQELSLAGCFPCVGAVRSLNFSALKAAADKVASANFGTEVQIADLDIKSTQPFFESATSSESESGCVVVKPELIDFLMSNAGISGEGRALPFLSETLRRLSAFDPAAGVIGLADVRWSGGIRRTFADAAEAVTGRLSGSSASFFLLMNALHPVGSYLDEKGRKLRKRPATASYLSVFTDPELRQLVDALIDARVLFLKGASAGQAAISWSIPDAILKWDRALRWLEENDRLLDRAAEFDRMREDWESEDRTPVKLLHATRAIASAREILDYQQRREILSRELAGYLEASVEFDERLGVDWRKRRWIRFALIGGGALAAVIVVILIVATNT